MHDTAHLHLSAPATGQQGPVLPRACLLLVCTCTSAGQSSYYIINMFIIHRFPPFSPPCSHAHATYRTSTPTSPDLRICVVPLRNILRLCEAKGQGEPGKPQN